MRHATMNLSSDSRNISGGIRSFWRRGFLCHGNDQAIRFMQRVRWKLVLSVVLVGPDPAIFFQRSEVFPDPSQSHALNPGVAQ